VKRSNLAFFTNPATPAYPAFVPQGGTLRRQAERLSARICFNKGRHFGAQARTFEVLAMTEWGKEFIV
jgi:hypothetical protein